MSIGDGRGEAGEAQQGLCTAHLRPGGFVCPGVVLFPSNVAILTSFSIH